MDLGTIIPAMPRRSAASLSVVSIDAARVARLRPPSSLSKLERETFVELAAIASHLKPADVPTLASYAQCVVLCRKLGRNPDKADLWQKMVRVQMALARSLRMTPQSRTDSRTAGRRQADGPISHYEEMRIENDAER